MARTKSDLATSVLEELRVLDAGSTPSDADSQYVQKIYSDKLLELEDDGDVYWAEDAIPNVVYRIMVRIVAAEVAPSFGIQYSPGNALADLRKHTSKPWTGEPVQADYF